MIILMHYWISKGITLFNNSIWSSNLSGSGTLFNLNSGIFLGLSDDWWFFFYINKVFVLFMNYWYVFFIDDIYMFFMNLERLMLFMNMFFHNYWLDHFMDNILMMFMNDIEMMFDYDILVMLVDNILDNLFDHRLLLLLWNNSLSFCYRCRCSHTTFILERRANFKSR